MTLLAPKTVCHDALGTVASSAKLEGEHAALSVFVTEMLYVTVVPGCTLALVPGVATTCGADCVHVAAMATVMVALVLVTDRVVIVMPETGSVKLLPMSRNASSVNDDVCGFMSRT